MDYLSQLFLNWNLYCDVFRELTELTTPYLQSFSLKKVYYRYETFKIVLFQKCYSYTSVPLKSTNPLFSKVILVQNTVSYVLLFNCIRLSLSIPICEASVSGSPYQTSTVHMQQVYINNNMPNACNILQSYSKHIL